MSIAYKLLMKGATVADGIDAGLNTRSDVVVGWYRDVANRLGSALINDKGTYRLGSEAEQIAARQARLRFYPATLIPWLESEYRRNGYAFGARGWSYVLEGRGLITKGDFAAFGDWLARMRKEGRLNPDVVADDDSRSTNHTGYVHADDPAAYAQAVLKKAKSYLAGYAPVSFWEGLDTYVEVLVEKSDLVTIFDRTCLRYNVPLTNAKGAFDVNGRRRMLQRFKEQDEEGREIVLLYFGDHDPAGLRLSDFLHKNLMDCSEIQDVQWSPESVRVERIGLSIEQIDELGLPWIDNLETSSGGDLASPKHKDHDKEYVQSYIKQFGVRKVEANALVRDVPAAQALLETAIKRYIDPSHLANHIERLQPHREAVRKAFKEIVGEEE